MTKKEIDEIIKAIKRDGEKYNFSNLDITLWDNETIVMELVKHKGSAFKNVSQRLKGDERVVLNAVKHNGGVLYLVSEKFQDNKEIVMAAVKQDGLALEYASEKLKGDKSIVTEATKENGLALIYANEKLQNDYKLLKIIEHTDNKFFSKFCKDWFEERMNALANIEEKMAMGKDIQLNNKKTKKIKF